MNQEQLNSSWMLTNQSSEPFTLNLRPIEEACRQEGLTLPLEITLLDRSAMREANQQFSGKNYPADTLSFPAEFESEPAVLLFCPREIEIYSLLKKVPLQIRWTHLIIHATAHAHGYDHHDQASFERMIAVERKILSKLPVFEDYELTSDYQYLLLSQS